VSMRTTCTKCKIMIIEKLGAPDKSNLMAKNC
jgi:hypothetical protein